MNTTTEYTLTDHALALVAEEREACAELADSLFYPDETKISASIRNAIRARTDDDTQAALVARDARIKQEARNEALREVINLVNGCDRVSEVQPAIENLITED